MGISTNKLPLEFRMEYSIRKASEHWVGTTPEEDVQDIGLKIVRWDPGSINHNPTAIVKKTERSPDELPEYIYPIFYR